MAEIEELADIPLVTGEVPYNRANLRHATEKLSPDERVEADRLIDHLITSIQKLNFIRKTGAKMGVGRLLHKLQMAHLGEDSVGVIAERVWWRLMKVSELGDGIPPDGLDPNCTGAEVGIAEDIIHKAEGKTAYLLIKETWEEMVRVAGPNVSSRVIRTVAREAWPKVRAGLKS
jgi:hypothetical protein